MVYGFVGAFNALQQCVVGVGVYKCWLYVIAYYMYKCKACKVG